MKNKDKFLNMVVRHNPTDKKYYFNRHINIQVVY